MGSGKQKKSKIVDKRKLGLNTYVSEVSLFSGLIIDYLNFAFDISIIKARVIQAHETCELSFSMSRGHHQCCFVNEQSGWHNQIA